MKLSRIMILSLILAVLLALSYLVKHTGQRIDKDPIATMVATNSQIRAARSHAGPQNELEIPRRADKSMSTAVRQIWSTYQIGDYQRALDLAQEGLAQELSPSDLKWIKRQIPIISVSLAWQYIQTSRCQDALELLSRYLHLNTEDTKLINRETQLIAAKGAAVCYFKAHRYLEAEPFAKTYASNHPGDQDMAYILSHSLEANQKFEQAKVAIRNVLDTNRDLSSKEKRDWQERLQALDAKQIEAKAQSELVSPHFRLYYRPEEHQSIAEKAVDTLEEAIAEFHASFGLPVPEERVHVHLYGQRRFHAMTHGPNWAQGIFDGHIRIPISAASETESSDYTKVLRHELVHALLSYAGQKRNIPSWFNEGLAIFLECPQGCREPRRQRLYQNKFLSLSELEQPFLSLSQRQAQSAYNQSLYLIQSLVDKYGLIGIQTILQNLPAAGPLNSNTILDSIETDFISLHALASRRWQKH